MNVIAVKISDFERKDRSTELKSLLLGSIACEKHLYYSTCAVFKATLPTTQHRGMYQAINLGVK